MVVAKTKAKRKSRAKKKTRAKRKSRAKNKKREAMLKIVSKTWDASRFKELGRGGEAAVYRLNDDTVAKVFLKPDAREFAKNPELKKAAKIRLEEMQTKLFEFPAGLPKEFVAPTGVLVHGNGRVFGYVMPFVDGISLDKLGRSDSIITPELAGGLLSKLHDTISVLHAKGVVYGDLNENNIIIVNSIPYLIDTDSMQFGSFQCRSFVPRFTAPEILKIEEIVKPFVDPNDSGCSCDNCDKSRKKRKKEYLKNAKSESEFSYSMLAPHNEMTDWYAFLVIAMRLLTFTDPYGGVVAGMDLAERIRERITIFDPRVTYPVIARPLKDVSRPVVEMLFRAFYHNERFIPDREVFDTLCTESKKRKNKKEK